MKFSVWPNLTGSFADLIDFAKHAEATGWDGLWLADHFMPNAPAPADLGPTNEVFTSLAGVAASVPRLRLGTLVVGNTYRHPAVLAKMAATVDNISNGRLILGLGSGWQENEHAAYGIEFATVPGRLRRLEEAIQIVRSLFDNERTDFAGKYYTVTNAPLAPKPVQSPLPILVGGGGEQLTMKIAAKYANEWNVWGTPELLARKGAVLNQHCEAIGRDPKSIKHSAQAMLWLTDDQALIERMKGAGRPVIAGNVEQVREVIAAYKEAGVDELIIPDFNLGAGDAKKAVYDTFINDVAKGFRD